MQLYPTPDNPAPPGAECREVLTRDGIRLRAMRVVPENPRGTVVILGGRGDFAERYFETMHELLARGFAVAASRGDLYAQRRLAEVYAGFGRFHAARAAKTAGAERLNNQRQACEWWRKELAVWEEWGSLGTSSVFNTTHRTQAAREVAECDSALARLTGANY